MNSVYRYVLNSVINTILRWVVGHSWQAYFATPIVTASVVFLYRAFRRTRRSIYTWLFDKCLFRYDVLDELRREFTTMPMASGITVHGHSHAEAARMRTEVSTWCDALATILGFKAFYHQMAVSDQRDDRQGDRYYHWPSDLRMRPRYTEANERNMRVLIDVDYYVDMRSLLLDPMSTILYTMAPIHACHTGEGGHMWTWTQDNELQTFVSGGARYTHSLWDYGTDMLTLRDSFFSLTHRVVVYNVERRQCGDHHAMVLLVPSVSAKGIIPWLLSLFLVASTFGYLKPVFRGFVRLLVHKSDGAQMSTGVVGGFSSITIPIVQDESIMLLARHKPKINEFDLRTRISDHSLHPQIAPLLAYTLEVGGANYAHVYNVENSVIAIHTGSYDWQARPFMTPFMPGFLDNSYIHVRGYDTDRACIQGRLEKFKANRNVKMTVKLMKYFQEFVKFLPKHLIPFPVEDIEAVQNRPSQRANIAVALCQGLYNVVTRLKAFCKAESFTGPKPPRNITTINPQDKLSYSQCCHAMADAMKKFSGGFPWYSPGMTPRNIAFRVADICVSSFNHVVMSDYHRWDGNLSQVLRVFERMVIGHMFGCHAHQVLALHGRQYGQQGVTSNGFLYDGDSSRCSGSPETAVLNTIDNAVIAYIALRMTYPDLDKALVMQRLGLYCGDDGITPDVNPNRFKAAAKWVGQQLEAEPIPRGQSGVKFLARYYSPEVWYGCPDSMCDVPRQLAKFHLSHHLPSNVTPLMKLVEKCRSYYLMDHYTPIIGQIATGVLCNAIDDGEEFDPIDDPYGLRSWMSMVDVEDQYPQSVSPWMADLVDQLLPGVDWLSLDEWCISPRLDEVPNLIATRAHADVVLVNPLPDIQPTVVPEQHERAITLNVAPDSAVTTVAQATVKTESKLPPTGNGGRGKPPTRYRWASGRPNPQQSTHGRAYAPRLRGRGRGAR